jgi:hypothetical protein
MGPAGSPRPKYRPSLRSNAAGANHSRAVMHKLLGKQFLSSRHMR